MNGAQGPTDPQAELLKVVADANRPPEPPGWVQKWQMGFAGLLFVGALVFAFVLVLAGPPAPKAPDGAKDGSQPASSSGPTGPSGPTGATTSTPLLTAASEPPAEGGTGESGSTPGDPSEPVNPDPSEPEPGGAPEESTGEPEEGSSGDSLASLNEQAPWAFAIVALLVGAFLATGKALSFSGVSGGGGKP